ncbi:metallophosphoesterase [Natronoglycomyces albus]|uniref:Metallophosphoesterase n=1 Tax=Natronoglycomyces albus TaxID=2811108 RepID=A0A895XVL2_9ACTN|nr:metallophosphoesterase [Natronoglycomyces albus]QSB06566.1 metallophosphoesterase [Natronoglycomyces albus]
MDSPSPLYVVSDVHGHYDALVEALQAQNLIDRDENWIAGEARLWALGDLFDRGERGVDTVRLLRKLSEQASAAGGLVDTLLGNHELLVLGSRRFGEQAFMDSAGNERQFLQWWVINGGFEEEMNLLTDDEVSWLTSRPLAVVVDQVLLVHSDTDGYLQYGNSIDDVNTSAHEALSTENPERWWDLFRSLTQRHDYLREDGPQRARAMLNTLGGTQIVHGHSTIPDTTDLTPGQVEEPRRYCDGLVLNVDGGVYQGGRCLVVRPND